MNDKKSELFIDAFKIPSDGEIKSKWDLWKKESNPCQASAIKWLQCMGLVKVSDAMLGCISK